MDSVTLLAHLCCEICHKTCTCSDGICPVSHHKACILAVDDGCTANLPLRHVTQDEHMLIRQSLENLHITLLQRTPSSTNSKAVVAMDVIYGIDSSVIDAVVSKCEYIDSIDDLLDKCNVFSYDLACSIYKCLAEIFPDIQGYAASD